MYPDQVRRTVVVVGLLAVAALLVACGANDSPAASSATTAAATSATAPPVSGATETSVPADPSFPVGTQHLHFEFGPVDVQPGQNNIEYIDREDPQARRRRLDRAACGRTSAAPTAPFRRSTSSTCTTACGSTRRDQTRRSRRSPSASSPPARRRRSTEFPPGYGYQYKATDRWVLNYMLHNLTSHGEQIWITYDIDFIPATAPAAAGIVGRPPDLDGRRRTASATRCSTSSRARARTARSPIPIRPTDPYGGGPPNNIWTVDRDGVLVGTGGHLHPGGLHDDLWLDRDGTDARTSSSPRRLLRARRRGLVGRGDDRHQPGLARSQVHAGDMLPHLRRPTTRRGRRGTSRWGSWSCGWPTARRRRRPVHDNGRRRRSPHPRPPARERQPRRQADATLPDADRCSPRRRRPTPIHIVDFVYGQGDMAHYRHGPDREGRAAAHVHQRRPHRRPGHLAHDHRVQGAVQPRPASPTRSPTPTSRSTRASSARRARPPPGTSTGRRRPTCRPAPTPTSAGSTRSCGVPSS